MDGKTGSIPLGQYFRLEELAGAVGKWLDVPPGRTGVVVDGQGRGRTLSPGRRLALSAFQRLRGEGIGLRAGYAPQGYLPAWLPAGNLLSGDGHLMDAGLWDQIQVTDPLRFFVNEVVPLGVVDGPVLDLSRLPLGQALSNALAELAREYEAADLVSGLPTGRLLAEASRLLEPALARSGMAMGTLEALSFRLAEDRVIVAEKLLALDERLQDVELQRQMAAIEKQVELQDFIRQLDPDLVEKAGLRPVAEQPGPAAVPVPFTAGVSDIPSELSPDPGVKLAFPDRSLSFKAWVNHEAFANRQKRPWLLERLFGAGKGDPAEGLPPVAKAPGIPWQSGLVWMAVTLIGAYLLTILVKQLAAQMGWDSPWEIITAIWLAAVGVMIERLRSTIVRQEKARQEQWALRGITAMDDLTGAKRRPVDALMRRQCKNDLEHARRMLADLQTQVYRSGDENAALRLRELGLRFDEVIRQVQDPNVGTAPYVGDLKISRQDWEDYLDYDEHLLVRCTALVEDVRQVQKNFTQGQWDPSVLAQLESRLEGIFLNRFENRSQALKASMEQQQQYRVTAG